MNVFLTVKVKLLTIALLPEVDYSILSAEPGSASAQAGSAWDTEGCNVGGALHQRQSGPSASGTLPKPFWAHNSMEESCGRTSFFGFALLLV